MSINYNALAYNSLHLRIKNISNKYIIHSKASQHLFTSVRTSKHVYSVVYRTAYRTESIIANIF